MGRVDLLRGGAEDPTGPPPGPAVIVSPADYTFTALGDTARFAAVSAGWTHTCAATGVSAYCWGDGSDGQIGDGATTEQHSPVLVSGGISFSAVSAGAGHTCGAANDGNAYCWGDNSDGQLGDGTTTDRVTPTRVAW